MTDAAHTATPPVSARVLGPFMLMTLLEGYRWTPYAVAGSLLAIIGLLFALRARSPAR